MSFQPIIQVTKVPRSSVSFFFKDDTGNYPTNDTGWGAPNGPTNPAQITIVWGEIQPYGSSPIKGTDVAGDIATSCEVKVRVPDGVNMAHVYYGQSLAMLYTVSADRLSLTVNDSSNLPQVLDNITSLSPSAVSFPVRIKEIAGNVILLEEAFPEELLTYTTIFRYWHAQQRVLVLNKGEATIVNEISTFPLKVDKCAESNGTLNKIIQKLGAEIAFSCGNYAKAHEAANLISGYSPKVSQNCNTCG